MVKGPEFVNKKAFYEGCEACRQGYTLMTNPYRFDHKRRWLAVDWRNGWRYENEVSTYRNVGVKKRG